MRKDLGRFNRGELILGFIWWGMFLAGTTILIEIAFLLCGVRGELLFTDPGTYAAFNLAVSLFNFFAVLLIFRRFLAEQFIRLRVRGARTVADLLLGMVVAFLAILVAGYLSDFIHTIFKIKEEINPNQDAVESVITAKPWMGVLLVCICAPVTEELLNRGLIFNPLCKVNRVLAYIVSMLVFSGIHVIGSIAEVPIGVSLANLVVYCAPGFALCWIYDRSRTIWSSIFLHMIYNGFMLLLQMLPQVAD